MTGNPRPIPALGDAIENPAGFPADDSRPLLEDRGAFKDVLFGVRDVVSDWGEYRAHLERTRSDFISRGLLISHDMSEIENITQMALGGVVRHLYGEVRFVLVNLQNTRRIDETIERSRPEWIGFNLYTGLTDHVFEWLKRHKLARASSLLDVGAKE